MQKLVRRLSDWAYSGDSSFVARCRRARMEQFVKLTRLPRGARIVDLGGTEYNWRLFDHDFHVTLVNLPGDLHGTGAPGFSYVEADACDLSTVFRDGQFDLVFSNSVIEHVGDEGRQTMFAREVRRLAPAYWVQTPSSRCPIEAHTGVPFYWKLPDGYRRHMLQRWHGQMPKWASMIDGTRVLDRSRMAELFPRAQFFIERLVGMEKSYAAFCPFA